MRISKLRNVLIAVSMAVFAGVLSLGFNVVFGVAAPTTQPGDAVNVGPTFSTVKTTGDAEIQGNLKDTVDGRVDVSGNLFVTEYVSSGDLIASDDITVYGSIQDPMDTIINIVGNLLSTGYISGTYLFASDDVIVSGDLDIAGDIVDNNGDLVVTVNGPFEATDIVSIGNNTSINGNLNVESVIQSGIVNNSIQDVRISDVLNIIFREEAMSDGRGSFKINGADGSHFLVMDDNELMTIGDTFHINPAGGQDVEIGISDFPSDVLVYGHVKATQGFGTYIRTNTTFFMDTTELTGWKSFTKACPAGQILVSCGGGRNFGAVDFGELYPNNNTCYLNIYKYNFGTNGWADITTMCLDPDA